MTAAARPLSVCEAVTPGTTTTTVRVMTNADVALCAPCTEDDKSEAILSRLVRQAEVEADAAGGAAYSSASHVIGQCW